MASTRKPKTEKGGRTKLTPEVQRLLIESIQLGCTDKAACQRAGIDPSQLWRWQERAEIGEEPFASFASAYARAKGDRVAKLAGQIVVAASADWRAAAWYLEHAESDDFSPKTKTEVTGAEGRPVAVQVLFGDGLKRDAKDS